MTPNHRPPACLNSLALGAPLSPNVPAAGRRTLVARLLLATVLSCAVFSGCKPFGTRADSGVDPDDWAPPNRSSYSMPHQFQSKYRNRSETAKTAKPDTKSASEPAKTKVSDAASAADPKKPEGSVTTSLKKEEIPNKQTAANATPVETGVSDLDLESAIANLPPHLQEALRNQLIATRALKNQEGKPQASIAQTSNVQASANPAAVAPDSELAMAKAPVSATENPISTATTSAVQLASNTQAIPKASTPVRMSLSDSSSEPASVPPIAQVSPPAQIPPAQIAKDSVQIPNLSLPDHGAQSAIHIEPATAAPAEPAMPATKQESLVSTASLPAPAAKSVESGEAMQLAASSIEKKLAENPSMDERVRLNYELALRMIHLANNDLEQALKPIDHLQPAEQEYYRYQLQALYDSGNPEAIPVASRRWALVMENQRKANQHLASISNLEVRNAAFCTDVQGYGVITKFQSSMFKPDQDVLLYCELENVSAEQIRDGFETQLQGSYEIVDAQGRRIAEQLLPTEKEICSNQRRDYYVVYRVFMPMQIAAGNYEMRVTIEDMKGKKYGQSNLPFQIQIQK